MSGFDENPFGEPNFNDPFSNPPVRQVPVPATQPVVDENPFANQVSQGIGQNQGPANPLSYGGQPATLQPSNQQAPPPSYARNPQQTIPPSSSGTFSPTSSQAPNDQWRGSRDSDPRNAPYYPKRNNWPPLPEQCCFQPCFYQDIDVEIHVDFQNVVRQLYHLWIFHELVLVMNVLGGFILAVTEGDIQILFLGLFYLILFTPLSFLCWFRPAYKAFQNDSSFNFMIFFFIFFAQLVVTGLLSVGMKGTGACGLLKISKLFEGGVKNIFVGLLMLIIAGGFIAAAVGDFLLLNKVHRIYRNTDASLSKAQQEFATNFMRNEHVQSAASNIAANAVRSQMAAAAGQPRY